MRLRSIFFKTLADFSLMMKRWAAGFGLAAIMVVTLYAALQRAPALASGWPGYIAAFFNTLEGVSTGEPNHWFLLAALLFGFPLALSVFAIELGSQLLAGRNQNGELELLLSYPLSRLRLFLEKFAVLVVAVVALAFVTWLFMALGLSAAGVRPPTPGMIAGLSLVALVFGSLAFAIAGRSAHLGRARLIPLALLLAAVLLAVLRSRLPVPLAWVSLISPLYDYLSGYLPYGSYKFGYTLLLAGFSLAMGAFAWSGFYHRELN